MRLLSPRAVAVWTAVSGVCAVVGTVVAVVQLGAGDTRESSSSSGDGSSDAVDTRAATTPPSTPTPSPRTAGDVDWRGKLVLPSGHYVNLDSTPPFTGQPYVDGSDFSYPSGDTDPRTHEVEFRPSSAAVWQNAAPPSLGQCTDVIDARERDYIEVVVGLQICVETVEEDGQARVFGYRTALLRVTAVDGEKVAFDVVRWAPL